MASTSKKIKLTPIVNQKREDYLHWDDYFMATAVLSSKRSSTNYVTKKGAVIVNEDNYIVATGYNNYAKCFKNVEDAEHVEDVRDDQFVVHAAANAIHNKNCINLNNTRLYTTHFPCNECAKLIIQSGIKKVYYMSEVSKNCISDRASCLMFSSANIEYIRHIPQQKQIVIDLFENPKKN